jgi:hypothetical protein
MSFGAPRTGTAPAAPTPSANLRMLATLAALTLERGATADYVMLAARVTPGDDGTGSVWWWDDDIVPADHDDATILVPAGVTGGGWRRVGARALVTCIAKASLVDTDYMTIADPVFGSKLYEMDTAGNGVTGGRVQVNVSADTTAAEVAARLRTAILANQPQVSVTVNGDTLVLFYLFAGPAGNTVVVTENVANAGFTVATFAGGV